MRQSFIKSFLIRRVACGINSKLKIVAGRNVTKNVKLTAFIDPNKYLDRSITAAFNSVAEATKIMPVIDFGLRKQCSMTTPAAIASKVPASCVQ